MPRRCSAERRPGSAGQPREIVVHREQIVAPAGRHRLPAVYPYCYFAANGGLVALIFSTSTGAQRRMSIAS